MRRLVFPVLLALSACPSPSGTEGPQGEPGPAGATGALGPVGPRGPQGDMGAPGAMGAAGTPGVDGPQGPAGPQGVQGPAGSVLVLDGGVVVGPPGSSVIVTLVTPGGQPCPYGGIRVTQLSDGGLSHVCNGGTVTTTPLAVMSPQCSAGGLLINLLDGGTTAICNGVAGATGPAGSIGPIGPTGMIGPAGAVGPPGMQGNTGAIGPAGPTGNTGPSGAIGPAGPTGNTGPVGAPGPMGQLGPAGPMGPPGAVLYLDGGIVLTQPIDGRPLLLGYTAYISNGNIGSRTIANARCHAEYAGTHLCTQTEFRNARSLQAIPGGVGAWIDSAQSSTNNDPDFNAPCNNYTAGTGGTYASNIALPNGTTSGNTSAVPNCGSTLPLACCTSPSSVRLRGYTSFTSTGNIGSRTQANARCFSEYPGTHLCNQTEFRVARSLLSIPGGVGAWLDAAINSTSTDPDFNAPCNNYTAGIGGTYASIIALPTGTTSGNTSAVPNCGSTLPLACCE